MLEYNWLGEIRKTEKEGEHLSTLEKYHMYKMRKTWLTYIDVYNRIVEVLQELNTR
jgi:hypothetical protein